MGSLPVYIWGELYLVPAAIARKLAALSPRPYARAHSVFIRRLFFNIPATHVNRDRTVHNFVMI
jgi:hypothetical protein